MPAAPAALAAGCCERDTGGVALFRHVPDHAPLYRALLHARTWARFHDVVRRKVSAVVRDRIAAVGGPRRPALLPTDLALDMISSALVGAIAWWLDGKTEQEPEAVAAWVPGFAAEGYRHAVGFDAPGGARGTR